MLTFIFQRNHFSCSVKNAFEVDKIGPGRHLGNTSERNGSLHEDIGNRKISIPEKFCFRQASPTLILYRYFWTYDWKTHRYNISKNVCVCIHMYICMYTYNVCVCVYVYSYPL